MLYLLLLLFFESKGRYLKDEHNSRHTFTAFTRSMRPYPKKLLGTECAVSLPHSRSPGGGTKCTAVACKMACKRSLSRSKHGQFEDNRMTAPETCGEAMEVPLKRRIPSPG